MISEQTSKSRCTGALKKAALERNTALLVWSRNDLDAYSVCVSLCAFCTIQRKISGGGKWVSQLWIVSVRQRPPNTHIVDDQVHPFPAEWRTHLSVLSAVQCSKVWLWAPWQRIQWAAGMASDRRILNPIKDLRDEVDGAILRRSSPTVNKPHWEIMEVNRGQPPPDRL